MKVQRSGALNGPQPPAWASGWRRRPDQAGAAIGGQDRPVDVGVSNLVSGGSLEPWSTRTFPGFRLRPGMAGYPLPGSPTLSILIGVVRAFG